MGRLSFQYVAPVAAPAAAAEWVLNPDQTYSAPYTGESLDFDIEGAFSAFAGETLTTRTALDASPINHSAPKISGPISIGYEMQCQTGVWLFHQTPISYLYQWYRNGAPIAGAVASTYTTQAADTGAALTCGVRGSNPDGTSAEVISNAIQLRATPWLQSSALFANGRLEHDGDLFVNAALSDPEDPELTFGAYNVLYYFAWVRPTTNTSSNLNYIFSMGNDSYLGCLPNGTSARAAFQGEDEDAQVSGGEVLIGQPYVAGELVQQIFYAKQSSIPGRVRGTLWTRTEALDWAGVESSRGGPLIATQFHSGSSNRLSIGSRSDRSRWFSGNMFRASCWANVPELALLPDLADVTGAPDIVPLFSLSAATLAPPDIAQGILGTPLFDFNSNAHFTSGQHDGSLPTFLPNGTIT